MPREAAWRRRARVEADDRSRPLARDGPLDGRRPADRRPGASSPSATRTRTPTRSARRSRSAASSNGRAASRRPCSRIPSRRSTTSCPAPRAPGPTPTRRSTTTCSSSATAARSTGSARSRERHPELFERLPRVVIDHHASNGADRRGRLDRAGAAPRPARWSTLLAARLGAPLDLDDGAMAAELMAGIVMDTATFAHPNATPRTLAVVGGARRGRGAAVGHLAAPLPVEARGAAPAVRAGPRPARDRRRRADHPLDPARRGPRGDRRDPAAQRGDHRPARPVGGGRGRDPLQGGGGGDPAQRPDEAGRRRRDGPDRPVRRRRPRPGRRARRSSCRSPRPAASSSRRPSGSSRDVRR